MGLLTDKLPQSVDIQGVDIPIEWDFRASILFSELVRPVSQKDSVTAEFCEKAITLYFPTVKTQNFDLKEAFNKLLWFYQCGKPGKKKSSKKEQKKAQRIFSYDFDGGYVYAAFLAQYGIDLTDPELRLHWWRFRALFDALEDDAAIKKIMAYRATDIPQVPKERQNFYRKMQRLYAIPSGSSADQQYIDDLNEKLAAGIDPGTAK